MTAVEQQNETITLEQFAEGLSDKYLQCRDLGHQWDSFAVHYDEESQSYEETLRCKRCKLPRKRLVDSRGYRAPSGHAAYDYKKTPGYLLPKGVGYTAEARALIRITRLRRKMT